MHSPLYPHFYHFWCSCFRSYIWVSIWYHFPAAWRTSFNTFFEFGWLLMKSPSFHQKMSLFCLHFWMIVLLDIELRFVFVFPCSTLKISPCCFLGKSAVIHIVLLWRKYPIGAVFGYCSFRCFFSLSPFSPGLIKLGPLILSQQ